MHLFLTGEFQIGKSTLINKVLKELPDIRLGGFRTVTRADIPGTSGSVYIIRANEACSAGASGAGGAEPFFGDENRVGIRCGDPGPAAFPEVFDRYGVMTLADAESCDLILMDEIGKMERKALIFTKRVLELLDGDVPVFGVLRKEGSTPLQEQIRKHPNVRLIEVTEENRDRLAPELIQMLRRVTGTGFSAR